MNEKAVLFSEMTPDAEWESEFNDWYDSEHIPVRVAVPGFAGAQRYRRNSRDYLAVYDLDEIGVLQSQLYNRIKNEPSPRTAWMLKSVSSFTRYICRPIGQQVRESGADFLKAPVLYAVFFTVPEQRLEEFDDWYDQDHVPTLLQCRNWLACRRFEVTLAEPQPFNRLALHYLHARDALDSQERSKARESDWRKRLAQEEWFKGVYSTFDRHGPRFGDEQSRKRDPV